MEAVDTRIAKDNLSTFLTVSLSFKESPQARLVSVQFANSVFPSTHIPSRYACMLAVADV